MSLLWSGNQMEAELGELLLQHAYFLNTQEPRYNCVWGPGGATALKVRQCCKVLPVVIIPYIIACVFGTKITLLQM